MDGKSNLRVKSDRDLIVGAEIEVKSESRVREWELKSEK